MFIACELVHKSYTRFEIVGVGIFEDVATKIKDAQVRKHLTNS